MQSRKSNLRAPRRSQAAKQRFCSCLCTSTAVPCQIIGFLLELRTGELRCARIASTSVFLLFMRLSRDIEHTGTGSDHHYKDHLRYENGTVPNCSQTSRVSTERRHWSRGAKYAICVAQTRRGSGPDPTAAWAIASTALLATYGDQRGSTYCGCSRRCRQEELSRTKLPLSPLRLCRRQNCRRLR